MHRVTSAEALSTSAGHAKTPTPLPVHDFLPEIPESLESPQDALQIDEDDVPLLQGSQNVRLKPKHAFNVSPLDLRHNEQGSSTAWREAVASLQLSAPITVQAMQDRLQTSLLVAARNPLQCLMQAISQFAHILVIMSAVGRLGVDELAGIAVGWTWFNLVRCFCFGLSGAYDTLGSQAFGSGNKVLVMSWAITASFAMLLVNVPVSIGMWHAGDAARVLFQQSPNVCAKTATFCRFMIPGLFPWSLVTILMKFLQVQGQMWAPALCTVGAIMLHIPCTILLVKYFGFAGGGYAVVVMRTAHFSFTVLYVLTLGKRYAKLDQGSSALFADSNKIGDEEDEPARASRTQPYKSDSASSFRISKSKAGSFSSDQSQLSLVDDTHDRQVEMQFLLSEDKEAQYVQKDQPQQAQLQQSQLDKQLLEQPPSGSSLQPSEQLLADAPPQHPPLLQLHKLPQTSQPLQDDDSNALAPSPDLHGIEQRQQSANDKHWIIQEQILPQKQALMQHKHQQKEQQQQQPVETCTSGQVAAVSHMTEADEQWSTTQLVLFSLRPARLWAFLGLGIPGGLASSVQSAAGEVTTAMAGILGTIQIDAHTTMLSVSDILFTLLGFGFAVGCTIRVGQLLGAQRPAQAKLAATVTVAMGMTAAAIVGLNMFFLSDKLCQAFTRDQQVLQTVRRLAPLLAFYSIMNGSGFLLSGALKGMGQQSQLMWVGIAGYWGCGVPLGYTLAFHTNLQLAGLWFGALTGALIVVSANLFMLTRVDWSFEAQKAVQKQLKKQLR